MHLLGSTWIFKDIISTTLPNGVEEIGCNDTSNIVVCGDSQYYSISVFDDGLYLDNDEDTLEAYTNSSWNNNTYKTITFINQPTVFVPSESVFTDWLISNATLDVGRTLTVTENNLKQIAYMIRKKTGNDEPLVFPEDFIDEIEHILTPSDLHIRSVQAIYTSTSRSISSKSFGSAVLTAASPMQDFSGINLFSRGTIANSLGVNVSLYWPVTSTNVTNTDGVLSTTVYMYNSTSSTIQLSAGKTLKATIYYLSTS